MEKTNKPKNQFLKFLNFQNPPFSPGRDHHYHHSSTRLKPHAHKGFSGPINFAVLPDEARDKPKNNGYNFQEPTSPKVSCIGQIKYKHKNKKVLKTTINNDANNSNGNTKCREMKKSNSSISKFFSRKPSNKDYDDNSSKLNKGMPSLGQMRNFASGRDTLSNFDWMAQIAPIDHNRDYFSDEDRRRDSDDEGEDGREVIIPFSAPILVSRRGGGDDKLNLEPRKEVNLWKRRTIDPLTPLALKSNYRVKL